MTEPAVAYDEAPKGAPRSSFSDTRSILALVLGALVIVGWLGLLVGSFAGLDESGSRLVSDVLVAVTLLAGVAGAVRSPKWGAIGAVSAVVFAGVWYFLGWGLSGYAVSDVLFYGVTAAFYLLPPVVGLSAILASRSGR